MSASELIESLAEWDECEVVVVASLFHSVRCVYEGDAMEQNEWKD